MADIRINALATTAASTASDDYIAIDGSANGTRKLNAYSPTFGGNLTVSGTGTSSVAGKFTLVGLEQTSTAVSGIQWKLYNSSLSGTNSVSIGVGKAESSGATVFLGWANNNGTPYGYIETYGGGSPFVLQAAGGNFLVGTTTDGGQKLQVSGTAYVSGDATFAAGVTINGKANFSWSGANGPVLNRTDGSAFFILNKSNGVNGVNLSATSVGALSFYTEDGLTLAATLTSSSASFAGSGTFTGNNTLTLKAGSGTNTGDLIFNNPSGSKYWGIQTTQSDFYIANADFTTYTYLNSQTFSAWTFVSDARLKKSIVDLDYGLNAVLSLKPRRYEMISSGKSDLGFIAQEVIQVIPEAVSGQEIEYASDDTPQEKAKKSLGISKDTLIPVVVKAIQELTARVVALENA